MKRICSLLALMTLILTASASRLDTVRVESRTMQKKVNVSVILPDKYGDKRLPTVYLLHGYGDNHLRGYIGLTNVRDYADRLGLIIVIPDAESSWYFDSPIDPKCKYETFVTSELIDFVDSTYLTKPVREARAVTGLSMGGHGALYLAIRHQDLFGAAGSMSGGVDFRPFPENWDIKKRLGSYAENREIWDQNTVMAQLPQLKDGALRIIIDCGTEDFFYEVNCRLHEALAEMKIGHEFTTRPGVHNWEYWKRSLRDHMLFFDDFFNENKK